MPAAVTYPHIVKNPGEPARLERHPRTRVTMIVADYLWRGWSAEEIVRQYPYLAPAEVHAALGDLRRAGCDLVTIGQYLQPSRRHLPVAEYVPPARFAEYATIARELGFRHVAAGPLVRSSYHAEHAFGPVSAEGE